MVLSNQTRIGWIDEFKGFVLLLVCLYHVEQSFSYANMGMLHLSALRMSAFFFISGMLFSTRRFPNFKSYFIHKSKVLLLPYILLSLLFLALDPVVYNFDLFPKAPRMTVMVAGKSSIGSGPLWFVFTLYSVSLMFYGVQKFASRLKAPRAATIIIAIASLAGGWLLYRHHIRLPLGIERDLTVLFFFACGWLSKEPIRNTLCGKGKKGIPWSLVVASSITAFILYAAFETDKIPNIGPIRILKGILRNISRNALVILAVHWYILLVMRLLFRATFNKPGVAYISIAIVAVSVIAAIPLFRCKLYKLLGKQPASVRESLNIRD